MKSSWISRRRPVRPLIRYSLWPLRYKRREMTTSPGLVTTAGFSLFFLRFPLRKEDSDSCAASVAAACCSASAEGVDSSGAAAGSTVKCSTGEVRSMIASVLSPVESEIDSDAEFSRTKRAASASSGSSMVMVTSARPIGGRFMVPLKMQSDMRPARRDLWLCSPSTQLMASTTLDLPQPFGPTMQVVPLPLKVTTVRSQKDLKPTISTLRSLSKVSPFVVHMHFYVHFAIDLGAQRCASNQKTGRGKTRRETTFLSSRGGFFSQRFCL